ncbi:MAG: transposase [Cypionkella sp.]
MTSKILALTDALGNLIDFRLLPGQAHDLRGMADLIAGLACGKLLADRAFDANWLREALTEAKIEAVILQIQQDIADDASRARSRAAVSEFDRSLAKFS